MAKPVNGVLNFGMVPEKGHVFGLWTVHVHIEERQCPYHIVHWAWSRKC